MIVLDTNALLWWRTQDSRLSPTAAAAIESSERILVPAIVCWEIARLIDRGRVSVDRPRDRWIAAAMQHPRVEVVPFDGATALAAADLARALPGDQADQMIAATAIRLGVPVATADGKLRSSEAVPTVW